MNAELREIQELLQDLRQNVTRLEDLEEIKQMIVTYARGADRGNDPKIIAPLFAEESSWECKGFGKYEGRDRLTAFLKAIAGARIWWVLHYMISPQIDVAADGQTAEAFWYLWAPNIVPNQDTNEPEPNWVGATYEADLVKLEGKWFFRRMELILNMASPFTEGWVKRRFPKGGRQMPYFMPKVESGTYHWCACGKSADQPFCDGSHKTTKRTPIEFTVEDEQQLVLCGCKYSKTKPYCDGSHLNLNL